MKKDPTEFRKRFQAWKDSKDVYEAGRPIELSGYKGGKDGAVHGDILGKFLKAKIGQDKQRAQKEQLEEALKRQTEIADSTNYGWSDNNRGFLNKQHSYDYIDPSWKLSDIPVFGFLKNVIGVGNKDASPSELALFHRHIGYPRDLNLMPLTNIRFKGDFNEDGSERLPNAEYTGLSPDTKNRIRKKIGKRVNVNEDGSWTQHKVNTVNGIWKDVAPEMKNFAIRENNTSGIYDIFDTYDFDFWHNIPFIKNREPGKQIEIRDTIWGPNANPYLYDPTFTTQSYKSGKDSGIYIKPSHRGKFTALKKRTGHSASWFKAHGTPAQKKMATFELNARKWHKK